jgi:molybdate transport system substrate-binding protein
MAELKVFCSGGFRAAYLALLPAFEAACGHRVASSWGSSVAGTPTSIPARMERNEPVDVVIMAHDGLQRLVAEGWVLADSQTALARSPIGVAVPAGAARPDLSSVEALKRALIDCRSLAISTSASGIFLSRLFDEMGLTQALAGKLVRADAEPVGNILARGEAEIGFQQASELLPITGIDYVGPLPQPMQSLTVFSAGVAAGSGMARAARELISYFAGPAAVAAIRRSGMQPLDAR